MNNFPAISIKKEDAFSYHKMKTLDYFTVDKYNLPIALMMENAGYHLATMVALHANKNSKIVLGIGRGNNGGGGLVAARRLKAWGYNVSLDIPDLDLNMLAAKQLKRTLAFGVNIGRKTETAIFVDAYFGFSQRLPLPEVFRKAIAFWNQCDCKKISLDVPSGLAENNPDYAEYLHSDIVLTLAYPKKVLYHDTLKAIIYVADLGIPISVYQDHDIDFSIPFDKSSIVTVLT